MVTWLLPWLVADGSWRFQLMLGERRTLTVFRRVGRAAFANPLMLRERTHEGTVGTIGRLSERAGVSCQTVTARASVGRPSLKQ